MGKWAPDANRSEREPQHIGAVDAKTAVWREKWQHGCMVEISDEDFDAAVRDGLDLVPPELAEQMDNVVVLVRDEPTAEQLTANDGHDLLGLYEGTPLPERDFGWASGSLPDCIFIFRGPLKRWCASEEELVEEIAVTVVHEIAHHFGIDDDRLHELGWA